MGRRKLEQIEKISGKWISSLSRERVFPKQIGKDIKKNLSIYGGHYAYIKKCAKEQGLWDEADAYSFEEEANCPQGMRILNARLYKF